MKICHGVWYKSPVDHLVINMTTWDVFRFECKFSDLFLIPLIRITNFIYARDVSSLLKMKVRISSTINFKYDHSRCQPKTLSFTWSTSLIMTQFLVVYLYEKGGMLIVIMEFFFSTGIITKTL